MKEGDHVQVTRRFPSFGLLCGHGGTVVEVREGGASVGVRFPGRTALYRMRPEDLAVVPRALTPERGEGHHG